MKNLIIISMLMLVGCGDYTPALQVPLNVIDKANEVCQSMDGVKSLRVENSCVSSGKYCSNTLITTATVTCNKFDAKVSVDIEWEIK